MPPAWLSAPVSLTRFQVSKHPQCFSKATLYYGAPLPSAGSARTAFPSVISTVRALRLPAPTTGSLIYSFPRCNFSPPRSLPCGGGIRRARSRSSRGTISYMKLLEHRISQVPGESIPYLCPALRSRPVDTGLTFTACTVLSPLTRQQRHRQQLISGLDHAASASAVYASSRALPHVHARLASGWWLAFAGWELNPLDSIEKFLFVTSNFLLSQAYPGATCKKCS
jgi:hypothetical protein